MRFLEILEKYNDIEDAKDAFREIWIEQNTKEI